MKSDVVRPLGARVSSGNMYKLCRKASVGCQANIGRATCKPGPAKHPRTHLRASIRASGLVNNPEGNLWRPDDEEDDWDNYVRGQEMFKAAKKGDAETLSRLLHMGMNPDVRGRYEETPLFEAVCEADDGHVECARLLLDHGASVASVCKMGRTPLHHAALADEATTVELLLDAGASLEQPDNNGETPLHWACNGHGKFGDQIRYDKPDVALLDRMGTVNCLLAAGAYPDVSSESGDTPLHTASKYDDQGCPATRSLLKAGASPNRTNKAGYTPMDFVLRLSDVEHVGMLLRSGANPNVPWSQLATAIDKSYESEAMLCIVELLLKHGADLSGTDQYHRTPMIVAADRGHVECLEILLEADAERFSSTIELCGGDDPLRRSPLLRALEKGHHEAAEALLDNEADVHARDANRRTALHIAVSSGNTSIVKLVLEYGGSADIKALDTHGYLPEDMSIMIPCHSSQEIRSLLDETNNLDAKQ